MTSKTNAWQPMLAQAFSNIAALCDYLNLDMADLPIPENKLDFPLRVPRHYAELMEKGNPHDPLLRQVLPITDEYATYPGYSQDPVGDLAAVVQPGLLHKYHGRVLLIVTGACAIHCRYCFRRNFPYNEQQLSRDTLDNTLNYLKSHLEISEIILSGGDPLLFSDERLSDLIQQLNSVPHLKRIRIHTRIPVVLPARITPSLLALLAASEKKVIIVTHANHGNEVSPAMATACQALRQNGVTLLNQSVLLAGVNVDGETLCQLSERLFNIGVLPYYLHILDKANGVGHFQTAEAHALALIDYLRQHLPGYLVPKLVKEQAGEQHKTPIF